MPYLKKADITDNVVGELIANDTDDRLARADEEVQILAETFGIREPKDIGHDSGDTDGTLLVNGAGQTGKILNVDGFTIAAGTIKQGAKIKIVGLRQTYEVESDSTISGNAATLSLTENLEASPADGVAVEFERLHPAVKKWLVFWVQMTVCDEFTLTADGGGISDVDVDKYFAKSKRYATLEKSSRARITREMLIREVNEILDVIGGSGTIYRQ